MNKKVKNVPRFSYQCADFHETDSLEGIPEDLKRELDRVDESFWVSREKLKAISKRFEQELDEGESVIRSIIVTL